MNFRYRVLGVHQVWNKLFTNSLFDFPNSGWFFHLLTHYTLWSLMVLITCRILLNWNMCWKQLCTVVGSIDDWLNGSWQIRDSNKFIVHHMFIMGIKYVKQWISRRIFANSVLILCPWLEHWATLVIVRDLFIQSYEFSVCEKHKAYFNQTFRYSCYRFMLYMLHASWCQNDINDPWNECRLQAFK